MTAGITGATRVYPHLAHASEHADARDAGGQVDLIPEVLGVRGTGQFHDPERYLVRAD